MLEPFGPYTASRALCIQKQCLAWALICKQSRTSMLRGPRIIISSSIPPSLTTCLISLSLRYPTAMARQQLPRRLLQAHVLRGGRRPPKKRIRSLRRKRTVRLNSWMRIATTTLRRESGGAGWFGPAFDGLDRQSEMPRCRDDCSDA
jgi:hypothetical protein